MEQEVKAEIIVATRIEGFHFWEAAPDEVAFLRNRHRHLFHVKAGMPVEHLDRHREFFIEQRVLHKALQEHFAANEHNVGSCEMICVHILNTLRHVTWVQVEEDGENGAKVIRSEKAP